MRIKIGEKNYKLNTKAITAIRFRAEYGFSPTEKIKEIVNDIESLRVLLACLVHTAIVGKKPNIENFLKICIKDNEFILKGIDVYNEIYRVEETLPKGSLSIDDSLKYDEFDTVALMGDCKIPERFLDELTISQINYIIMRQYQMKSRDPNAPKMAINEEIKANYNITPEREKAIAAALKAGENRGK